MNTTRTGAPLDGIRVIELAEWIAGPYGTKMLGDLGATVDKYEWGDGDPMRLWGPFTAQPDPERSPQFGYLNTSKSSHSIEDTTEASTFERLLDGLIGNYDVAVIDQHFLKRLPDGCVDRLVQHHPRVIIATITPYGMTGPHSHYRAYDINVAARGGTAYGVGDRGRAPLPLPANQSEHHAGLTAAIAILMALIARDRDGTGQHIDHSSVEVLASLHAGFFLPLFVYGGGIVGCRNGRESAIPTYPNGVLPCIDGLFAAGSPKLEQWLRFVELMGTPEWTKEPRYRDRRAMALEYKAQVDGLMIEWSSQFTKRDLYDQFLAHKVPCAPLLTGEDLLNNDHLAARQALIELDLAGGGSFVAPRSPFRFSRSLSNPTAAPRLGPPRDIPETPTAHEEHPTFGEPPSVEDRPDVDAPPLAGLRVLDLGTAWAGGLAGRFLGDYGADVIKVESWSHMDGSRMGRPLFVDDAAAGDRGEWPNMQPGFHVHSRSKRSITLNLKSEEGRGVLLDLARSADVILHNFPRGVVDRLGLSSEKLLEVNPTAVIAGQSVAGGDGPASAYIGYAGTVGALSGLGHLVGYDGEEAIGSFQGLYCDVISALTTVLGALVALVERSKSGSGQAIDVSQWEGTMSLAAASVLQASTTGNSPTSMGFDQPLLCPHGTYPSKVTDGEDPESAWVSIAVGSRDEWWGLLKILGPTAPLPSSARDWTLAERREHHEEIDRAISAWTRTRDRYDAEAQMQQVGVAAGAVQNVADMFSDPQLEHRGSFIYLDHPRVGAEPMPGLPWRLTRTPGVITRPAPDLGADTREVLIDELGMAIEEFDRLVSIGAIEVGPTESSR